jgi:hypothetical protein
MCHRFVIPFPKLELEPLCPQSIDCALIDQCSKHYQVSCPDKHEICLLVIQQGLAICDVNEMDMALEIEVVVAVWCHSCKAIINPILTWLHSKRYPTAKLKQLYDGNVSVSSMQKQLLRLF